ncbi:MAG: putative aromatic compound monooxygenase yhjG [Nocardia sp.]|uniref:FAD-dependent monooxygenase n=1 Tax=Nocardia sp. TaxID=1821 RepID=UPI0026314EF8|nr:FAD-dependent monooxygenase [Nocardia sp.]MCU1644138.1 putative aromatic compound monooxygenase yhjG [Nocardia sp.]
MTSNSHYEVVVVGSGPVGSLLAAELGRWGVRVAVIEAAPATTLVPKAGTIHARSIQLLTRRGYFSAPNVGFGPQSTVFHYAGQPGLEISVPGGEGPAIVGIGQGQLESSWSALLPHLGVEVVRPATVTGVFDSGDGVEIRYRRAGVEESVSADWVVGADGARSVVRTSAGFPVTEVPPTAAALLGLARLGNPAQVVDGWVRTPRGWTVINRSPVGRSRVITFDMSGPERDHRRPLTPAELQQSVEHIVGHYVPMHGVTHLSRFSDFSRLVDSYRHGRALVIGDAAHVHFPLGGQGLNLGIADAVQLGWRLGLITRLGAPAALLDAFSAERRPAAARVIANVADQADRMRSGPEGDALRAEIIDLFGDPARSRALGNEISAQVDGVPMPIETPAVGSLLTNRQLTTTLGVTTVIELLAQRAEAVLLVAASREDELRAELGPWHDRVDIVPVLYPTLEYDVLLRPDGFIAWSSAELSARLRERLTEVFGAAQELRTSLSAAPVSLPAHRQ